MSPDERAPEGTDERSVGELVVDVSERVSILIREEIELAKAEVREKVTKLVQGSIAGLVAGVFAIVGFALLVTGIAWLLNDLFFSGDVWAGFLIEAAVWFLIAGGAGFFAYRSVRAGAPPTPELAIEEARRTKETLEAGSR